MANQKIEIIDLRNNQTVNLVDLKDRFTYIGSSDKNQVRLLSEGNGVVAKHLQIIVDNSSPQVHCRVVNLSASPVRVNEDAWVEGLKMRPMVEGDNLFLGVYKLVFTSEQAMAHRLNRPPQDVVQAPAVSTPVESQPLVQPPVQVGVPIYGTTGQVTSSTVYASAFQPVVTYKHSIKLKRIS